MFKRMFQFSENETPKPAHQTGVHSASVVRLPSPPQRDAGKSGDGPAETPKPVAPASGGFQEVYATAGIGTPANAIAIK